MAVEHGLLLVVWGGSFSPDQVKVLCMWFQISCTPSHNGIRAPGLGSKEGAVAPAWTGHSRRRQQRSMYVHNLALHSCTHDRPRSISASTAAARHWRSSNRRLRSTCTLFCTISSRQQEPFAERPRLIRWPTSCATTAHMRNTPLPTSTDGVFMLSCGKPYQIPYTRENLACRTFLFPQWLGTRDNLALCRPIPEGVHVNGEQVTASHEASSRSRGGPM